MENLKKEMELSNYILMTDQFLLTMTYAKESAYKNEKLSELHCKMLDDAKGLVSKITGGAELCEANLLKPVEKPSIEGLSLYGYALDTIGKAGIENKAGSYTRFFRNMESIIDRSKEGKATEKEIRFLEVFFDKFRDILEDERKALENMEDDD